LYLQLALQLPRTALGEALEIGTYGSKVGSDFLGGLKSGVNRTANFLRKRRTSLFDLQYLVTAIDAKLAQVKSPS
jgi:hypothetical protein